MLLDALPDVPIAIADGVSIIGHDIECHTTAEGEAVFSGSLEVSLWERKIELRSVRSSVFEGQISDPIVDLGPMGALELSHLRITIKPATAQSAVSFDFTGRGRLELRGLSARSANPFVVEGDLHAVHSASTGDTYLRLDLESSAMSLPIAGGAVFSMMPQRLFFMADEQGNVELEMRVACSVAGLPHFVQSALGHDTFTADVHFSRNGLSLHIGKVYEQLNLVLPSFPPIGHLPAIDLGEITLSAQNLRIEVGREFHCSIDIAVHTPHVFRSFAEPQFSVRFTANGTDVEIRLLSSPLRAMKLKPGADRKLDAHVDLGRFGAVFFAVPVLRMDWASGTFVAEGRFSYRDLRIPLAPIHSFLKASGMSSLAERLPESVVLQPFGLTGVAAAFTNLVGQTLNEGVLAQKARDELHSLVERLDRLPKQLRESFLHIEIPTELSFRVEITSDLAIRIRVSPPLPPLPPAQTDEPSEAIPVKLLVPLLGPNGPELLGLSLYHVTIAQIRTGQLFTVEVDAEVDRFDLLPIALSMTLAKESIFSSPDELEQRFSCRNMLAILAFPAGTPMIVPIFVDRLAFRHAGLDGLSVGATWSFPAPKVDFASIMRLIIEMGDVVKVRPGTALHSLHLPTQARLALTTGPFWLRLPNYLGGRRIDIEQAAAEIQTPETCSRFLAALQNANVDGLLETIPFAMGEHVIEFDLGPAYRKASRLWTMVAEPALFVSSLSSSKSGNDDVSTVRDEPMMGKLKMWKGRLTDGLSVLGGDKSEARVCARLVGVTSRGIAVVAILPNKPGAPPVDTRIELHWSNFLGSAAALASQKT